MIEIKTGNIPCCVYISDVEEHGFFKPKFLNLLDSSIKVSIEEKGFQSIYNTDFFNNNFNIKYNFITPILEKHNTALASYLQYHDYIIKTTRIWYQQYAKGGHHYWHRHNGIFSNIYYVDLPDQASKTSFRFLGKEFSVDVKEGQILTFPSYIEHCSKPNMSDKIKTVISFNTE